MDVITSFELGNKSIPLVIEKNYTVSNDTKKSVVYNKMERSYIMIKPDGV